MPSTHQDHSGDVSTPKIASLFELSKHIGMWWLFDDVAVVTQRPESILIDESWYLHSDKGKSIEYSDGWGIYAWHGVVVPGYVIEYPERITIQSIESMQNLEVRRVLIERYELDRYLIDSGAELLHHDEFGDLFLKTEERDEDIKMVKVKNSTQELDGSFKYYFLRVPLWVQTAKEAVAWTFDMNAGEYQPKVET